MSQALVTSNVPQQAQYGRKLKKSDYRPVSHRWRMVLDLHLAGRRACEIQEATGYSSAMVHRILADPRIVELRQQVLEYYDQEFMALQPKVNNAVRRGLDSQDNSEALQAAALWLKHSGKGVQQQQGPMNITAESVAVQILNEAKNNGS